MYVCMRAREQYEMCASRKISRKDKNKLIKVKKKKKKRNVVAQGEKE